MKIRLKNSDYNGNAEFYFPKIALASLPIGSKSRRRISTAKNTANPTAAMSKRIAIPIIIWTAIGSESNPEVLFAGRVFEAIKIPLKFKFYNIIIRAEFPVHNRKKRHLFE